MLLNFSMCVFNSNNHGTDEVRRSLAELPKLGSRLVADGSTFSNAARRLVVASVMLPIGQQDLDSSPKISQPRFQPFADGIMKLHEALGGEFWENGDLCYQDDKKIQEPFRWCIKEFDH